MNSRGQQFLFFSKVFEPYHCDSLLFMYIQGNGSTVSSQKKSHEKTSASRKAQT